MGMGCTVRSKNVRDVEYSNKRYPDTVLGNRNKGEGGIGMRWQSHVWTPCPGEM